MTPRRLFYKRFNVVSSQPTIGSVFHLTAGCEGNGIQRRNRQGVGYREMMLREMAGRGDGRSAVEKVQT